MSTRPGASPLPRGRLGEQRSIEVVDVALGLAPESKGGAEATEIAVTAVLSPHRSCRGRTRGAGLRCRVGRGRVRCGRPRDLGGPTQPADPEHLQDEHFAAFYSPARHRATCELGNLLALSPGARRALRQRFRFRQRTGGVRGVGAAARGRRFYRASSAVVRRRHRRGPPPQWRSLLPAGPYFGPYFSVAP